MTNSRTREPLVDAPTLAGELAVSTSWVYYAARVGLIPCHRIGKYIRFKPSEVYGALAL
ncbi:MAG: helix-turn-helix domain-containing protein [Actinobacteria bacterium]|nr:MAG: helix-turn-helix domain-containing protein [Actinomycetota bacterium]